MTDEEVLAMLVHLHGTIDSLAARVADLEAAVEHLEVYAL